MRIAVTQGELPPAFDTGVRANLALSYVAGKWHRFAKSGWKKLPTDGWEQQGTALLA